MAATLSKSALYPHGIFVGLDVGSTTVKAVVMNSHTDEILWSAYERHGTRQVEKVYEYLKRIEQAFPIPLDKIRVFITGSGGGTIGKYIGAKFVQEVNAVSLAVEKLYPDAGSVIELGGQDAKIIIWIEEARTGRKHKFLSMNDKCAGGTGAIIDKISAKLQLSPEALGALHYDDVTLHPVAGKCGVFAETDINGLQKQGVPPEELMASLFEAIVQQNLSVLTRGNTLHPKVLLLGGPNTFIPAMRQAWQNNIPKVWQERNFRLPDGVDPKELIVVPHNAQYYAAIGSVLYGKREDVTVGIYTGTAALEGYIEVGRKMIRESSADKGLVENEKELLAFKKMFQKKLFKPPAFLPGEMVEAYMGIDGGSTSTKGVLLDEGGRVLAKAYQLSKGNPLQDTKEIVSSLRKQIELEGARLEIKGVGTTGYAKDMLKECIGADVALVETVAHTQSALHYYKDVDVIVDVGGQDIKVIVLKNGNVKDFKLNTQCSAGNGYFLQSTAQKFGFDVAQYADIAFQARSAPVFNYGCAVFLESDIVNFQQLGWERSEIMAGLAKVLPKNIWLYVVQEPNLARLGKKFVLQGGTQNNLAAVKAQYDFIKSKVPDATIYVHDFCGESGAIGAALETIRVLKAKLSSSEKNPVRSSRFIGLTAVENLEFTATRDESTRCYFCKNRCLRTFVDTRTPSGGKGAMRRFIIASCEKGTVESVDDMKTVRDKIEQIRRLNPNFAEMTAKEAFKSYNPERAKFSKLYQIMVELNNKLSTLCKKDKGNTSGTDDAFRHYKGAHSNGINPIINYLTLGRFKARTEIERYRKKVKIGIPRVLNMYSTAPFFTAYLESVGVEPHHIRFSDYTDEKMWKEGSRRGSIDQCFPSKAAIAHIHNLIFRKRESEKVDIIFFPILYSLKSELANAVAHLACPTVAATPEVSKAAFTKEEDVFAQNGIRYYDPVFHMAEPKLFELELYNFFKRLLGVTKEENRIAIEEGYKALQNFVVEQRTHARKTLEQLESENRVGVVLLGRPYHCDPGLNHEILGSIQKLGYPIFTILSLPVDEDILKRLFGEEIRNGEITSALDITDVWKNCYSENSNMKVWGAKYVARHPNLVALDLSSFRCGHDAPIYSVVESIVEATETPYFTFHDIDENKPSGSIKIRVETINYFLKRYQEILRQERELEREIEIRVCAYRQRLKHQLWSDNLAPIHEYRDESVAEIV